MVAQGHHETEDDDFFSFPLGLTTKAGVFFRGTDRDENLPSDW